jgi:hypothetical protein
MSNSNGPRWGVLACFSVALVLSAMLFYLQDQFVSKRCCRRVKLPCVTAVKRLIGSSCTTQWTHTPECRVTIIHNFLFLQFLCCCELTGSCPTRAIFSYIGLECRVVSRSGGILGATLGLGTGALRPRFWAVSGRHSGIWFWIWSFVLAITSEAGEGEWRRTETEDRQIN